MDAQSLEYLRSGISVFLSIMVFRVLEKIMESSYEYLTLPLPVDFEDFLEPPHLKVK